MDKKIKVTGIKTAVWSVVTFLIAYAATKILDKIYDISTLAYVGDLLTSVNTFFKQEHPTTRWHLLAFFLAGVILLVRLGQKTQTLRAAQREIELLKNPPAPLAPPTPSLSDIEHSVIMTIAALLEKNQCPDDYDIMAQLSLTPLPTQAAIDVLTDKSLITTEYNSNLDNYWDLTPKGRLYALNPANQGRRQSA